MAGEAKRSSEAVDSSPTNGADKYLIEMYYELVITLHNGPRCNTIDREKFICPHLPRIQGWSNVKVLFPATLE